MTAGLVRAAVQWMRGLMVMAALITTAALAQTTVLEVIPLKYRSAEQVIPVIQPMIAQGGSLSGFQNQLVIRTTPDNLQEIRRILARIDTAPRRLLITVRQDADSERSRRAAELSGSISSDGDSRVRARVLDSRALENDRNTQTLQVLEGNSAFISVGQSVPVQSRQVVRSVVGGRTVEQVGTSVEYRDVTSGFYVLPRVTGDRVMLEVSPQHDTLSAQRPGAVNVQRVSTTVSARLGEWIELGGVDQTRSEQRAEILGSTSRTGAVARQVLIKVEELK